MKSKRGGSSLTQLAVPAALFYANQAFGSRIRYKTHQNSCYG